MITKHLIKKWMILISLWSSLFLVGCASVPEPVKERLSIKDEIAPLVFKEVEPIVLPSKFKTKVTTHVDDNGKTWALVDPDDLASIKLAYTSAEGNAELVNTMNDFNRLVVERANMMRDLVVLEEYRSARLELRVEEEREAAEAQRNKDAIDIWLWRAATILSLAVGL